MIFKKMVTCSRCGEKYSKKKYATCPNCKPVLMGQVMGPPIETDGWPAMRPTETNAWRDDTTEAIKPDFNTDEESLNQLSDASRRLLIKMSIHTRKELMQITGEELMQIRNTDGAVWKEIHEFVFGQN